MQHQRVSLLTETIYDAAVDPDAWARVMDMLKEMFSTSVYGFYLLDFTKRAMKSVHVGGLSDHYRRCFDDRYFTNDNPWPQAKPLHVPGVVRTDDRLAEYFRDPQILRRSQYYNDWMRPQDLEHTLGVTLLSERGVVGNLTLLRSADRGSYRADEIAVFERVCRHLRRALRIAMRLEAITAQGDAALAALDSLPFGIAFLDLDGKLLSCNESAETLIRTRDGIAVRNGRLIAAETTEQPKLRGFLRPFARDPARSDASDADSIAIQRGDGTRPLILSAIRLSAHRPTYATTQPTILVLIADPAAARPTELDFVRRRYQLTPAEARLAAALLAGDDLRRAADTAGMTYETARWYLKILFQKTQTRRQAELVGRLLRDMAASLKPSSRDAFAARTWRRSGDA
jgi:DNA-binding CsgD family transcriptional regulator